ncbi:MAG TPA: histidine kinase, partial [Anaerolineae bacterium]|nr:histidine kinase [Anaerolineae bacterium]
MSLQRLQSLGQNKPSVPEPVAALTPVQVIEQTGYEYEQIQKELKEIDILVKQSSAEVEKLAQRNAQLTNKVRTMEGNIDTVPRQDIKEIYNAAQEAQMRLFMMRGQVEQLQSRQENLKRYAESLRKILDVSGGLMAAGESGGLKDSGSSSNGEVSGIVKIINAQETERQRLANQLHDGPAQSLTNLILQAEICERLFDTDPVKARTEL